ncbi:MAG: NAD(P)H-dependent oxidoreductase subunit E [Candidatus Pacebacteria bacterium]|nr:NAD(P)H-dependent oxidoreductase subunit E [Candidatus Paceibacterota bacterium]
MMNTSLEQEVKSICASCDNDRTRMMDIVRAVQETLGYVPGHAMDLIASELGTHRVEVESVVSFYAFLSSRPQGKTVIRLCDDIIDRMAGIEHIAEVFKEELGIDVGETTDDGALSLEFTPCIGMCDQAPAALINDVPVTALSSDRAREIVQGLKNGEMPKKLVHRLGDGNNADPLVHSMVQNNIRKRGDVIFSDHTSHDGLKKALGMSPAEVIREIKAARLRGRGGAGFPTGMKWDFTRGAEGEHKVVICNADEGEPGTFKDRAVLTERADLLFEGMALAGYAVGADTGILYLRAEYAYLRQYLENVLKERRDKGLLGKNVCGKEGFDFDIRIQMGAGAYICGEETALISSCEGLRGDPKNRPPFPAQKGYLGRPTTVNNVETFCCAVRIIENGAAWFANLGTHGSPGTKLLSVSGDCEGPGIYEVPFGITVHELLKEVGAENCQAVQIGGPSGQLVGPEAFDRKIEYDDLATGGSVMVFNNDRKVLEIVDYFMDFFIEESCGYCTPCRVGNVLLKERLAQIMNGKGTPEDLPYLERLGNTVKTASRCGLGQTSPNPILSSLQNFRSVYDELVKPASDGMQPSFDIAAALKTSEEIAERKSTVFTTA